MKAVATTAAFVANGQLHAARSLHQTRRRFVDALSTIRTLGWCGTGGDADEGIHFVPSWIFDGRGSHENVEVCIRCSAALCALSEPQ